MIIQDSERKTAARMARKAGKNSKKCSIIRNFGLHYKADFHIIYERVCAYINICHTMFSRGACLLRQVEGRESWWKLNKPEVLKCQ